MDELSPLSDSSPTTATQLISPSPLVSPVPVSSTTTIRITERDKSHPAHLNIYECSLPRSLQHTKHHVNTTSSSGVLYPISTFLSTHNL